MITHQIEELVQDRLTKSGEEVNHVEVIDTHKHGNKEFFHVKAYTDSDAVEYSVCVDFEKL